jgi:hypothetical protein
MGWGVNFNADIYLSHQSYSSKYEVEEKIKNISETITEYETKLKMFAIATPRDIVSIENSENILEFINEEIVALIELYEESVIQRYQLMLFLEYLEDKEVNKEDFVDRSHDEEE